MDKIDRIRAQWRSERPDLSTEAMATIGRIRQLHMHLARAMERTMKCHGLNLASFDVLTTLRRSGPPFALSPGDLLKWMMVSSGTMTNRINQLETAKLVERVRNPQDARGFIIHLTKQGRELIDGAMTAHVATQAELVKSLSEKDKTDLDKLLRNFLIDFEDPDRSYEEPSNDIETLGSSGMAQATA